MFGPQTLSPSKKPVGGDWHPVDIIAELFRRRTSLARLSRERGYAEGSLRIALRRPWPKAERIIATALKTEPQLVWPSRYRKDGTPKKGRAVSNSKPARARRAA